MVAFVVAIFSLSSSSAAPISIFFNADKNYITSESLNCIVMNQCSRLTLVIGIFGESVLDLVISVVKTQSAVNHKPLQH